MKMHIAKAVAAMPLIFAAGIAWGDMPISTDGTDPATWNPKLEATRSGTRNHKVIFENDDIRVLSVTVRPGETEKLHHHQWPSVLVIDSLTRLADFDKDGKEQKLPLPDKIDLPLVIKMPPQAAHSVRNLDDKTFHLTRIEFKKGFPVAP